MASSRTAEYVALYRALEGSVKRRPPLFQDPFATAFLSPGLRRAVTLARITPLRSALERYADYRAPGARTSAIGRTAFIDDSIRVAVRKGVKQLVILGAGYDCRAHRLPDLRDVRVFEVDRAATQDVKRARLDPQSSRSDVNYVAVDFAVDDLETCLLRAGYRATEPTFFLWEGVTNYLNAQAVAKVLGFVGRAAAGSRVLFTYVHRGLLDGTVPFVGGELLMRNVRQLGEPWTFGLDPDEIATYLGGFGLALEEDLGADMYRARYAIKSPGYAFYRLAVATVTGKGQ